MASGTEEGREIGVGPCGRRGHGQLIVTTEFTKEYSEKSAMGLCWGPPQARLILPGVSVLMAGPEHPLPAPVLGWSRLLWRGSSSDLRGPVRAVRCRTEITVPLPLSKYVSIMPHAVVLVQWPLHPVSQWRGLGAQDWPEARGENTSTLRLARSRESF